MKDKIEAAVIDMYIRKINGVTLRERNDGLYESRALDTCSRCKGATFSSSSGAHNKSPQHVAELHEVPLSALNRALRRTEVVPRFSNGSIGYKLLVLKNVDDGMYTLRSPNQSQVAWNPYEVMHAECAYCSEDEPVQESCSCGIYGFWTPKLAYEYESTVGRIVAKVEIGGSVVVADLGFRAEYAKIVGVVEYGLPSEKIVCEAFNVPLAKESYMYEDLEYDEMFEVVWFGGYHE